jgi:HlyD family secretion protein
LQYQTATVARGELTQVVTATGQLNPVVNVQVGSQVSGRISKIYVDFNSLVKTNDLLAELDPATFQASLSRAEGDLASARAALELAKVDARRAEELFRDKLLPQSDHDKARATLLQAEAQVKIREAAVESAKVDLSRCKIYSPVDGIVISRNVDVGQTVAASLQAPTLFVIANDLTKMQIHANVSEADIGGVEVGQEVEFTVDAFPNRTFRGKVVQVRNSPIIQQNVVNYATVIEVSNPDMKLKPGMTANVFIVVAQREQALKLPNTALRYRPASVASAKTTPTSPTGSGAPRGGGISGRMRGERQSARTVYVLPAEGKNGAPQPAQIKVGISDGVFTEVLEGLKEGDRVVTGETTKQTKAAQPTSPFGGMPRRF